MNNNTQEQRIDASDSLRDIVEELKATREALDEQKKEIEALRYTQEKVNPITGSAKFVPIQNTEGEEQELTINDLDYTEQQKFYAQELNERRQDYANRLLRGSKEDRALGAHDNHLRAQENIFLRGCERNPKILELTGNKFYYDNLLAGRYDKITSHFVNNKTKREYHLVEDLGMKKELIQDYMPTAYKRLTPLANNNNF